MSRHLPWKLWLWRLRLRPREVHFLCPRCRRLFRMPLPYREHRRQIARTGGWPMLDCLDCADGKGPHPERAAR